MSEKINITADSIIPSNESVYDLIEIYNKNHVQAEIVSILKKSIIEFENLAEPRGIFKKVSASEFEDILEGEGNNVKENPVEKIFPVADEIALFAVTIGDKTEKRIKNLFETGLYPEGYMLDAVASCGVENAADYLQKYYTDNLIAQGRYDTSKAALRYSPGYCGWDISGQKKLFGTLNPGIIEITLNDSFVMKPLKSISGIIMSGDKSIHSFINYYDFCVECKDYGCKSRVKQIFQN